MALQSRAEADRSAHLFSFDEQFGDGLLPLNGPLSCNGGIAVMDEVVGTPPDLRVG